MMWGLTYNANGQIIPSGLHIPQNLAAFPYVPHPLQLTGSMMQIPFSSGPTPPTAGNAFVSKQLRQRNAVSKTNRGY